MADSVTTVHGRMLEQISDEYDKSKGEFFYDVLMPIAIELSDLDRKSDGILDKGFTATSTGADLDRKCAEQGITRKASTTASGVATLTGVAGAAIVKGELVASDNVSFEFATNAVIPAAGSINIAVNCKTQGAAGNVPAGAIRYFPKTLEGLRTVMNALAISNGYDAESDDSLRERYFIKVRTPATSGNVWHYLGWAKEVTGVGDARVTPLWNGNGTVKVTIISSNKTGADSTLVDAVAAHIEENRPIGATVTVASATELKINITATVVIDTNNYTTEAVRQQIGQSVTAYLAGIAFKETYVSYAKIGNTILECAGVLDYSALTLNGGTSNIVVKDYEVAVLGGVTLG